MATAASPAALPSWRESFQTETDWRPWATRLRAALSPSWPETGTDETLGLERRDDAAGHAVVLGEDGVDLVVDGGQALLHVGLGVRGIQLSV